MIVELLCHLKKSSLEMLFIIGASRCVWGSMPPGSTNLPFASIIRALESPCTVIEVLCFAHEEADHLIYDLGTHINYLERRSDSLDEAIFNENISEVSCICADNSTSLRQEQQGLIRSMSFTEVTSDRREI